MVKHDDVSSHRKFHLNEEGSPGSSDEDAPWSEVKLARTGHSCRRDLDSPLQLDQPLRDW
jgi:hypothetical protein